MKQIRGQGHKEIEEEFRSQNSGAEPETLRLRSESRRSRTRFPQRYQSGIQTAQELFALASRREDHQIENLVGVQKRRLFIRQSERIHC